MMADTRNSFKTEMTLDVLTLFALDGAVTMLL